MPLLSLLLNHEHSISLQYLDDFKYILSHCFLSTVCHIPLVLYINYPIIFTTRLRSRFRDNHQRPQLMKGENPGTGPAQAAVSSPLCGLASLSLWEGGGAGEKEGEREWWWVNGRSYPREGRLRGKVSRGFLQVSPLFCSASAYLDTE